MDAIAMPTDEMNTGPISADVISIPNHDKSWHCLDSFEECDIRNQLLRRVLLLLVYT